MRKAAHGIVSKEAALALVVALVALALDQADIHIMIVSWVCMILCIILSIDALRKSTWVSRRAQRTVYLGVGSIAIVVAFLCFGLFLSAHKKPVPGYADKGRERALPHQEAQNSPNTATPATGNPPSKAVRSQAAAPRTLQEAEPKAPTASSQPAIPDQGSSRQGRPAGDRSVSLGNGNQLTNSPIVTGDHVVVNPLPAERTWRVPVSKCDRWVEQLNAFGATEVSVGAFISNDNGMHVAGIIASCLGRSTWTPSLAVFPVNPDGVVVGASGLTPKFETVVAGLRGLGLRVTASDIRPAHKDSISIVVGTNPIDIQGAR
jgi:hypothetical protein